MTIEVQIDHRLAGLNIDVSFETGHGITTLFGPSGAGKTTVINIVAGLLRADSAYIRVGDTVLADTKTGLCVPPHQRRIGYVFQDARLFPHLRVRGNLLYGRWANRSLKDPARFDHVVTLLGLGPLLDRAPRDLSGGEKQRVAIGRALLAAPQLLLLDEPLAALDDHRKSEILPYLERLRDETGLPMLHVSHSVEEVARLAQTVVVIEGGRSVASGRAADVLSDASLAPVGIRAVGAVLDAVILRHHDDGLSEISAGGETLFLPEISGAVGAQLRVRIAAHDVILSRQPPQHLSALNALAGTITAIRSGQGPGAIVTIDTKAGPILCRITRRSVARMALGEGQTCFAILKTVAIAPEDVSTWEARP